MKMIQQEMVQGRNGKLHKYQLIYVCVSLVCLSSGFVLPRTAIRNDDGISLGEKKFNGSSPPNHQDSRLHVCWTKGCIETASDLLNAMNPNVNPCEDFYSYACGGWIKQSNKSYVEVEYSKGQFSVIEEENEKFLKGISNNKEMRAKYSKIEAINKALIYYESCLAMGVISSRGGEPLLKLLKSLGLLSLIDKEWNEKDFDLTNTSIQLSRDLNIEPFFYINVKPDLRNSSRNIIKITQSMDFSLPLYVLIYNSTRTRRTQRIYKELIKNMTLYLGATDSPQLEDDVDEILEIEKEIAKLVVPFYSYDENELYRKMKIKDLMELTGPAKINWLDYIRRVFINTGKEITAEEEITVFDQDYMVNITKLINSLSKRTLANYISWRIVDATYFYLGKDILDIYANYSVKRYGSYKEFGREKLCFIEFKRLFGIPLSRVFVEERFRGDSKKLVKEIVENIREVFIKDLENVEWMEEQSRLAAIDKAKVLSHNIGFPDYIMEDEKLNKEFEDVVVDERKYFENSMSVRTSVRKRNILELGTDVDKSKYVVVDERKYFENSMSVRTSVRKRNILELGTDVDKSKWGLSPIEVNAYYEPSANQMVFPAGILQFPFYNKDYLRASSYGAIGFVIGHELSHGFDDKGSEFDKNGNLVQSWSKTTMEKFNKRAQCFKEQYDNLTYHGVFLNGARSLSENIADNVGILKVYKAYQEWTKENGAEPRLPGTMLTNDQVFFISFARSWCKLVKPKGQVYEVYGSYAPVAYRVNATLQNIQDFAKAFDCPLGSPMNPRSKCKIW